MNTHETEGDHSQTLNKDDTISTGPVLDMGQCTGIPVSDPGSFTIPPSLPLIGHTKTVTKVPETADLNEESENEPQAPTSRRGRKRKPRKSPDYLYTPVATRINTKPHEKKEQKIIQRNPFKNANPESESGFIWLIETKSALPAELCTDYDCNQSFRRKRHFHCRLCDNSKLGPIETIKKYWNHLDRHLKNFIPVNGKMLCECRMHCTDNEGVLVIIPHFHCPCCPHVGIGTLYTEMLLHIDAHQELSTEPVARQEEEFVGFPTKARQPRTKPTEELNIEQILKLPKKARPHKEHAYYIKKGNKKKNLVPPSEIFDNQSVSLNPNLFEVLSDDPETILAYIANHANIRFERDSDSKYTISGSVDDVQEAYNLLSEMVQKASQGNSKTIDNFQNDENIKGVHEPGEAPLSDDSDPDDSKVSDGPPPNQVEKIPCVCLACKKEFVTRNSLNRHMLQAHNYTVCECGVSVHSAEGGENHECDLSTRNQYKEVEVGNGAKQYVFLPSINGKKRGRCLNCGEIFTGKYKDHHRDCKQIYMTQCDFVWRCPRCGTILHSKDELRLHIEKCGGALEPPKQRNLMYSFKGSDNHEEVDNCDTPEVMSPNMDAINRPDAEPITDVRTDSMSPNPDVIHNPNTETMTQVNPHVDQTNESNTPQNSDIQSANSDRGNREDTSSTGTEDTGTPKVIMKPNTGECCCQICGETMELKANIIAKHGCFQKKLPKQNTYYSYQNEPVNKTPTGSTISETGECIESMSNDDNSSTVNDSNVDLNDIINHSEIIQAAEQAMEENLNSSKLFKIRGNTDEMNTKKLERMVLDDSELLYRCRYFLCKKCGQMLKTRRLMKEHIRRVHMTKSLLCAHCGKAFSNLSKYRRHQTNEHNMELKAACKICNRMLLKTSMEKHLQRHEGKVNKSAYKGPKDLKCTQCDYLASFPSDMRYHIMKVHSGRYTCPHCSTRFGSQYRLEAHIRDLHTNPGRFECHICDKKFNRQSYLSVHIQRHNNVKRYHCEICNKGFLEHYRMVEHLEIHKTRSERQFPFICEVCNKGFSQKRVLDAHVNTHTGERPYNCKFCDFAFSSQSGRAQHVILKHNINLHSCVTCGMSFKLRWKLKAHMKKHTGDSEHQCQQCGKRFTLKSSLNRHIVSCVMDKANALAEATARNCAMTALLTSAGATVATLPPEPQAQMSVELFMCCGCNLTFTSLEQIDQHSCANDATVDRPAVDAVSGDESIARIESPHISATADDTAEAQGPAQSPSDNNTDSNPALGSDVHNTLNLQNVNIGSGAPQLMKLSSNPIEGYIVPSAVPNVNVNETEIAADVSACAEQPGTELSQVPGIAGQQFILQRDHSDASKLTMIPYSLALGNNQVAVNTGMAIVESEGERYMVGNQGRIVVGGDGQQYMQIESGGQQFQVGLIQEGSGQGQQSNIMNDNQQSNFAHDHQQRNLDSGQQQNVITDQQQINFVNDHIQGNVDNSHQQSNVGNDHQQSYVVNDHQQSNVVNDHQGSNVVNDHQQDSFVNNHQGGNVENDHEQSNILNDQLKGNVNNDHQQSNIESD